MLSPLRLIVRQNFFVTALILHTFVFNIRDVKKTKQKSVSPIRTNSMLFYMIDEVFGIINSSCYGPSKIEVARRLFFFRN